MTTASTTLAPIQATVHETVVRLIEGDLTALPVDAIVFYARQDLQLGSGFGTAIQVRGGDAVKKELEKLGAIRPGEAAITSGGNLKARHIIHACGPKFQEPYTDRKLRECMTEALKTAGRNGIKRIAFPPMGAGFYGVPLELCASVMVNTLEGFLQTDTPLQEVIICVKDRREFAAFAGKIAQL